MFIGRDRELDNLNRDYKKNNFQFAVIYGRRRVGKTTLINEFNKNKKAIYFVAAETTAKENLEILSYEILSVIAPKSPRTPFLSFREAIDYVFQYAKDERIVFAIDEYPYLAQSDRSVSSILQALIDKYQESSRLFLILCGSSMSFMENQVLGYKSPLYGRRTSQYKILPFNYIDSSKLLTGFKNDEKMILYSITGGIPEYLSRVDTGSSLEENVYNLFLQPSARLFEEPSNLLKQELKMPQTYNGIISAIATGSSRLNEIATKAGIETSQCSVMINALIDLGIVKKEYPITSQNTKKTIYSLEDQMFRFWYRFVSPNMSRINAGYGRSVCEEIFREGMSEYMGHSFEEISKQYMWVQVSRNTLPFVFLHIGRWWGSNKTYKQEEEIDILAYAKDKAVFGECKWKNTPVGLDILEKLIQKSGILDQFSDRHYILFSKSGFTDSLITKARNDNRTTLVNIDDMFD
jgi:hypothetical protein